VEKRLPVCAGQSSVTVYHGDGVAKPCYSA